MLEATVSLSPKALERIRKHRAAVRTLAMYRAKQAVKEDIRARGLKIAQFSAKEIAVLAEAELEQSPTSEPRPCVDRVLSLSDELGAITVRQQQSLFKTQVRNDRGICASIDGRSDTR